VAVDTAGVRRAHRGMGLVSDVFSETVRPVCRATWRSVTRATPRPVRSVIANAQPILAGYHEGPLALGHNGNLTNAEALRADLVARLDLPDVSDSES